jgi:hypothetical protein
MIDLSSICLAKLSTNLPRFVIVYRRSALFRATSDCRKSFLRWYANLPDSFFDLNPASDFSSEYVSGPLEFKIRRISILFGLAITEKIILTRFEADSKIPSRLGSD